MFEKQNQTENQKPHSFFLRKRMPVVYISGPDDHIKRQIAIQEFRIFAFRKADGAIQHKTKLESACPMQPGVSCGLFWFKAQCRLPSRQFRQLSNGWTWTIQFLACPCCFLGSFISFCKHGTPIKLLKHWLLSPSHGSTM